jgi:hypothetical protein
MPRQVAVIVSGQSGLARREDSVITCWGFAASLFSHFIARILLGVE